MTINLPKAIKAYFEVDRTGSSDAIAATFTENGITKVKGHAHRGRDAIRPWMADEAQQYSCTVEPFLIATANFKTQVTARAVGDFLGSPIDLRFLFALANDKVTVLEITV